MPELFWVEREWHGSDLTVEVWDHSPLPLDDPEALLNLTRPRHSAGGMLLLFAVALLSRLLRGDARRMLRTLLKRSYV
jgi:hypothetical protein